MTLTIRCAHCENVGPHQLIQCSPIRLCLVCPTCDWHTCVMRHFVRPQPGERKEKEKL